MKLLAVDFGMKRMGFAVGNSIINTAVPIEPLVLKGNVSRAVDHILGLVEEYDVQGVLVGLPLNMDGSKGTIAGRVERFAGALQKKLGVDIEVRLVDERLSSFEAEEMVKGLGIASGGPKGGPKKKKARIDSMAALVILRRFMEST